MASNLSAFQSEQNERVANGLAISFAAKAGHTALFEHFLAIGADPRVIDDETQMSAIEELVQAKNISLLLKVLPFLDEIDDAYFLEMIFG